MPLGTVAGLGPGDIVLDGDPAPLLPPRRGTALPNFRPMSIASKGLIKMPVGTEVDLALGHIVLDGDAAPLQKGEQQPPILAHVYYGKTVDDLSYC